MSQHARIHLVICVLIGPVQELNVSLKEERWFVKTLQDEIERLKVDREEGGGMVVP